MTSQPIRIDWLDVHAHYVADHYAEARRAAGHGRPDGTPGLPGWSSAAALEVRAAAGVDAAVLSVSSPGVRFGADSLGTDPAASVLFPRLLSATKGSP
ncbi:hypothetical protein [Streptosporangium sp. 'caverna']|uniref:hypothetical protein n=1 Tax=Streptosporangium sp. 'caverna' TaxID=2202249 RepID=UPI000D7E1DC6|nr:hypothetical protein [Streptosporangium sp. 'caverna']AWS44874.1 hypothetical protein DKM19_29715 [Streptosporangium sp. 'caverna']